MFLVIEKLKWCLARALLCRYLSSDKHEAGHGQRQRQRQSQQKASAINCGEMREKHLARAVR